MHDALPRIRKYCVYQERSHQEVRDKLYDMGLHRREVEQVVSVLIEEGYINEQRFADAYALGKFKIKKWGKLKISGHLKVKKISDTCIRTALMKIDDIKYRQVLMEVLEKKSALLSGVSGPQKNKLLYNFALNRGFEPELIREALEALI